MHPGQLPASLLRLLDPRASGGLFRNRPEQRHEFGAIINALFFLSSLYLGESEARRLFRSVAAKKRPNGDGPKGRPRRLVTRNEVWWRALDEAGGSYRIAAEKLLPPGRNSYAREAMEQRLRRHVRDVQALGTTRSYRRALTEKEETARRIVFSLTDGADKK
jgi:hypothetical protein